MKKTPKFIAIAAIFAILISITLSACGGGEQETGRTDGDSVLSPVAQDETPDATPEPASDPMPTLTPEELAAISPVELVLFRPASPSDLELIAGVQVRFATEDLLDLFDSYHEFVEGDYQRIVISTEEPLENFRFVELEHGFLEDIGIYSSATVLYTHGQLMPDTPFVVTWMEQGNTPYRGVMFSHDGGEEKLFAIVRGSGEDSIFLHELEL